MTNKTMLGALALLLTGAAGFAAGALSPRQAVKPTEQHEWLASLAGEYTGTMRGIAGESKVTRTVENALGGLWSVRHFESRALGQSYSALEIMGYDPLKEKFVSVWVDSHTPLVITSEGTYDEATKTLTMTGISRGMDGAEANMINKIKFRDDGMDFEMHFEGLTEPLLTVDYDRVE